MQFQYVNSDVFMIIVAISLIIIYILFVSRFKKEEEGTVAAIIGGILIVFVFALLLLISLKDLCEVQLEIENYKNKTSHSIIKIDEQYCYVLTDDNRIIKIKKIKGK